MKCITRWTMLVGVLGFAVPTQAQEGEIAIGYFITSDLGNVLQLEEGMREHTAWHGEQNDPWQGYVYQATTGGVEYVWVSPGHQWADFDNPGVDPHADMSDFVQRAGDHVTSIDVRMWRLWSDVSMMPAPDVVIPMWQVIEFDFMDTAEGREALHSAFAKIKHAMEEQGSTLQYGVNEVVSSDAGPELFVGIARGSMGELDLGDPNGMQTMLTQVYGHAEAVHIIRTLEKYLTVKARRFWTLREDLSYTPGM